MFFRVCLLLIITIISFTHAELLAHNTTVQGKPQSLASLFESGNAVQDTDGDSVADSVCAIVVIPERGIATAYHAAAAAEIAARLGYETVALSFPVVSQTTDDPDKIVIRIALRGEVEESLKRRLPEILPYLIPGRGAVIALEKSGDNNAEILIVGGDGPGLHAAAATFAARWPNAWEIWGEKRSTTLDQIELDARSVLDESDVKYERVGLTALVYEIDREKDKSPDLISEEKRKNLDNMLHRTGEVKAAFITVSCSLAAQAEQAIQVFAKVNELHRQGGKITVLNYPGVKDSIALVHAPGVADDVTVPRFGYPARMLQRRPDPAAMRKPKPVSGEDIDLTALYSTAGLFADTMEDNLPDRIETTIVIGENIAAAGVGNLAARLGLESSGVSLPIADVNLRVDQLVKIKQPILVGEGHGTKHLFGSGRLEKPDITPGQGFIAVVPEAFNESNAIVILGDEAGIDRALAYLAETYPGLGSSQPGELTIKDICERSIKLLNGTSPAGQFLGAAAAINAELTTLKRRSFEEAGITIFTDKPLPGLKEPLTTMLSRDLEGRSIAVEIAERREPNDIYDETLSWQHEVEECKSIIEMEILPELREGGVVAIDIRLSEPPEILVELHNWLMGKLKEKGIDLEDSTIRILCAYKQGFHWLRDEILPKLRQDDYTALHVTFQPYVPDFKELRKFYAEHTRWLSELYPIDEVVQRDLGDDFEMTFEMVADQEEVYRVSASKANGEYSEPGSFSPRTVSRPYLNKFPDWAVVTVQTGSITVALDGVQLLDRRIKTDPERMWEDFQKKLLAKAYDHVMEVTGKKPTQQKQPFFHSLVVEAWLSEPDERLGIDEELVSATESLHEDIYFGALDFFNGMVPREAEDVPEEARYLTRIGAPGSVIPLIHPVQPGEAPRARFIFRGNKSTKNKVIISWKPPEEEKEEKTIELKPRQFTDVKLSRIFIEPDGTIACSVSAATKSADTIGELIPGIKLLGEGTYSATCRNLFDHPKLAEIRFDLTAENARKVITFSTKAPEYEKQGKPLTGQGQVVRMDEILDPDEAVEIARRLGAYSGVRTFKSGTSYQGRDVYSLEVLAQTESTHLSRAKLIVRKPTILVVGRQHANEVSSTTHILRLAELLATDPEFSEYRKKLNIILHPMENPDGAALMERLIELNPNHMNHASRYTSLGTDLGTQHRNPDTLLTEALVRPMLWQLWLPDIFLNCHGYPSHEWVQQFSGYSPYQFRDYWIPRGWFVYLTHLDDPRHPDHRAAAEELLSNIDLFLSSDDEQLKVNRRMYDRYWRWAGRWQPHIVNFEVHGETMIYADRMSDVPRKPSKRTEVTALEGIPEAMDETPGREWMEALVGQGLYYLQAHLRLLADARDVVEQLEEESGGRVHRSIFRRRPITLSGDTKKGDGTSGK